MFDSCFKCAFWLQALILTLLSMAKAKPVPEDILKLVRNNFVSKRDVIVSHSKPWTPWALAQLLEIDDTHTTQPAEIILYKALKASAPNRIGIADTVIEVNRIFYICLLYTSPSPRDRQKSRMPSSA